MLFLQKPGLFIPDTLGHSLSPHQGDEPFFCQSPAATQERGRSPQAMFAALCLAGLALAATQERGEAVWGLLHRRSGRLNLGVSIFLRVPFVVVKRESKVTTFLWEGGGVR